VSNLPAGTSWVSAVSFASNGTFDGSITAMSQSDATTLLATSGLSGLPQLQAQFSASSQDQYQSQGLTAAYVYLGFGVPTINGFVNLVTTNDTTDFGSGPGGPVFNQENVFINEFVNLYSGNSVATTTFNNILSGATTLSAALTAVYDSMVPTTARTAAGLSNFLSEASYFTERAAQVGLTSVQGEAIVGAAALANILANGNVPGLGQEIDQFLAAVTAGTAAVPQSGSAFTPILTAIGSSVTAGAGTSVTTGPITTATLTNTGSTINLDAGSDNVTINQSNYAGSGGSTAQTATLTGAVSGHDQVILSAFTSTSTITDFTSNALVTSAPFLAAAEGNVAHAVGAHGVGYFTFGGNEFIVATGTTASTGATVNNFATTGNDVVITLTGGNFHHITDIAGVLTLLT
jgi:hypothetical protein